MDLVVVATALLVIVPVELPDKTFVATLVLATRYRPLLVWIGVGAAFAVQTLIAVTLGGLLAQLPTRPVTAVAALLFAIGAVVLFRSASKADAEEAEAEAEYERKLGGTTATSPLRVVGTSVVVLFLAEWGDLSQLLTAGLVVRYDDPVSVFAGAWTALLIVSGLGALLGQALLRRVSLATVRRIGGSVCALLAVLTAAQALGVDLPL